MSSDDLLIIPTDTVYGVGANPTSKNAVSALLRAKGRTETMPPPILAADWEQVFQLVPQLNEFGIRLGKAFWPGALTLIAPTTAMLGWDTAITGGTIAIRIPGLELTRQILRMTGPLAVTSANLHGEPPATDLAAALEALGDKVAIAFDGGKTPGNIPSTIVDTRSGNILRKGVISTAQLAQVNE